MRFVADSLGSYNLLKIVCDSAVDAAKTVAESDMASAVLKSTTIAGLPIGTHGPANAKAASRDGPKKNETEKKEQKKPETNGNDDKTTD